MLTMWKRLFSVGVSTCRSPFTVRNIDHVVLTVRDIDETIKFYETFLSMTVETFGENRKALKFGNQKFNLHQHGNEYEPKARCPQPGSLDICLISSNEITDIVKHLEQNGVPIEEGVVQRTGATGKIQSVYIRDPDLNLIEISVYE